MVRNAVFAVSPSMIAFVAFVVAITKRSVAPQQAGQRHADRVSGAA